MAVTTDKVVVELQAKLAKYQADIASNQRMFSTKMVEMERAAQRMEQRTSASFGRTGGMLKNLFAGGAAGLSVGALAAFARSAVKSLGDIADNAVRAGLSIKEMQRVTFAFVSEGGNAGDAVSIFQKFNKEIADAVSKGGDLADILKANNVPLKDMQGNVRNNVDLFAQVLDLIKNAKNETDRQLLAQLATGRSANEFLQIVAGGGDAFKKLGDEAERVGAVVDDKLVKAADEFDTAWNKAWETFSVNGRAAAGEIINELYNLGRIASGDNLKSGNIFDFTKNQSFLSSIEQAIKDLKDLEEQQKLGYAGGVDPKLVAKRIADQRALIEGMAPIGGRPNPGSGKPSLISDAIVSAEADKEAAAAAAKELEAADKLAESLEKKAAENVKQLADATDTLFAATRREIEMRKLEAASVGKSVYEHERLRKQMELMNALEDAHRQNGGAVTPEEVQRVNDLADNYGKVAQAISDNQKALDELRSYTDVVFSDMESALDNFIDTGKLSFKDLALSIIRDMAKTGIHNLLNGAKDGSPGSGGGGIVGWLSSLMGGGGKGSSAPAAPSSGGDNSIVQKALGAVPSPGAPTVSGSSAPRVGTTGLAHAASIGATAGDTMSAASAASDGITDISNMGSFNFGKLKPVQGLVFHHTGGRGSVGGVMNTFKERNFPAQYIMDRDGKVYQALKDGQRGQHIRSNSKTGLDNGLSNANTLGVEVIAKNDADITQAQIAASAKLRDTLSKKYNFDPSKVYGHGELDPGHKQLTEGSTIANFLRDNPAQRGLFPGATSMAATAAPSAGAAAAAGAGDFGGILSALLSLFGGARAGGGPVSSRKAYLVGENGPEMFSPSQSGFVVPNIMNKIPGNENNAGNNAQFHVNVTKSKYFDVHISRQVNAGNTRTLDMARRQMPDTQARFNKLGTTSR